MAKKPPIAYINGKLCSSTNKCPELEKFQKWAKEKDPSLLPVYGADGEWGPESEKAWAQEGQNYEQFQTEQKTTQKTEVDQKVKENEELIKKEKEKIEETTSELEILTGLQARYESELQRIRQPVSLDVPEQIEPKKHKGIIRGIVSFFKKNIGPNRTDGNSPVQGVVGPAPLKSLVDENGERQPGGFLPIGYIKTPFGDIKINPNISKIFNKNRSVSTQKGAIEEAKEVYSEVFEDQTTRDFKYGITELQNSINWPGGQVPAPVPAGKNDRESFPGGFDTKSWIQDPSYSSGALGTPFENEDPVYFTFDLEIDSLASPIINGRAEEFIVNFGKNFSELGSRQQILHTFIYELSKFFKFNDNIFLNGIESMYGSKLEKKYYIKRIDGLDKLIEKNDPEKNAAFVQYKKENIKLHFYEDTLLSTGTLESLYKLLYWSRLNGKNIIPENLLRFDCKLIISEGRNIVRHKTKTVQTEDGKTIQTGEMEIVRENVSRYVYSLYECQFFFNKMTHPDIINLEEVPKYSEKNEINISYKYSNLKFQRFVFTDSVNGEYRDLNDGKYEPWVVGPADTNYAVISDRDITPVKKSEEDKSVSEISGSANEDAELEDEASSVFGDEITGGGDVIATSDDLTNAKKDGEQADYENGLNGEQTEEDNDSENSVGGDFVDSINQQKLYKDLENINGLPPDEGAQGLAQLKNQDKDPEKTGPGLTYEDPSKPGHKATYTKDGVVICSECTKEQFDALSAQIGQDAAYNEMENDAKTKANATGANKNNGGSQKTPSQQYEEWVNRKLAEDPNWQLDPLPDWRETIDKPPTWALNYDENGNALSQGETDRRVREAIDKTIADGGDPEKISVDKVAFKQGSYWSNLVRKDPETTPLYEEDFTFYPNSYQVNRQGDVNFYGPVADVSYQYTETEKYRNKKRDERLNAFLKIQEKYFPGSTEDPNFKNSELYSKLREQALISARDATARYILDEKENRPVDRAFSGTKFNRQQFLQSLAPEDKEIIEQSNFSSVLEPDIGSQARAGFKKLFGISKNNDPDLTQEEYDNISRWAVFKPLSYPTNLVKSALTGKVKEGLAGEISRPLFHADPGNVGYVGLGREKEVAIFNAYADVVLEVASFGVGEVVSAGGLGKNIISAISKESKIRKFAFSDNAGKLAILAEDTKQGARTVEKVSETLISNVGSTNKIKDALSRATIQTLDFTANPLQRSSKILPKTWQSKLFKTTDNVISTGSDLTKTVSSNIVGTLKNTSTGITSYSYGKDAINFVKSITGDEVARENLDKSAAKSITKSFGKIDYFDPKSWKKNLIKVGIYGAGSIVSNTSYNNGNITINKPNLSGFQKLPAISTKDFLKDPIVFGLSPIWGISQYISDKPASITINTQPSLQSNRNKPVIRGPVLPLSQRPLSFGTGGGQ